MEPWKKFVSSGQFQHSTLWQIKQTWHRLYFPMWIMFCEPGDMKIGYAPDLQMLCITKFDMSWFDSGSSMHEDKCIECGNSGLLFRFILIGLLPSFPMMKVMREDHFHTSPGDSADNPHKIYMTSYRRNSYKAIWSYTGSIWVCHKFDSVKEVRRQESPW